MLSKPLLLPQSALLGRIGAQITAAGGHAVLVGGAVRDMLLGKTPKDLDIEIFGLAENALVGALRRSGHVDAIGKAFKIWRVRGLAADFTLPRAADFAQAVRHRDLTINSIGLKLPSGQLIDPLDGQQDLQRRLLRACDARFFGDDPLRALRVAQLMARLDMQPEAALTKLCRGLDLSGVAAERIYAEFVKLLLQASRPSVGLVWLSEARLLKNFAGLQNVAQDFGPHCKTDAFSHTCNLVDQAAALRDGGADDLALMWGALLHAAGRPYASVIEARPSRASRQDITGVLLAQQLLNALKAPHSLTLRVTTLVRYYQIPAKLQAANAPDSAYRQLCRAVYTGRVCPSLLARLAQADQSARTTLAARHKIDVLSAAFLARVARLGLLRHKPTDVVQAQQLLDAGLRPGPLFGVILKACRHRQDATGHTDPKRILKHVLNDFLYVKG